MAGAEQSTYQIQKKDLDDTSRAIQEFVKAELKRQLPEAGLGALRLAFAAALGTVFFAAGLLTGFIFAKAGSVGWKELIGLLGPVAVLCILCYAITKLADRYAP
jgi:hypothetical protein